MVARMVNGGHYLRHVVEIVYVHGECKIVSGSQNGELWSLLTSCSGNRRSVGRVKKAGGSQNGEGWSLLTS